MNITPKTPQERLEIKEFILDANLYLISNSLQIVSTIGFFFYFIIFTLLYQGSINLVLFLSSSFVFIVMLLVALLGFKSIRLQKEYISRLESVFEDKKENGANNE
jgi:hypothetical protein